MKIELDANTKTTIIILVVTLGIVACVIAGMWSSTVGRY
jgi:hypothetical protein